MVILFLSCKNLPRQENQTTVPNPPTTSKLLRFYLMSKVCPNSFAIAYNNEAYALVKKATHIRLHPGNINRDSGIEIPEAWTLMIKKHSNRKAM
ncbi:hypothetical protein pdam_00007942 [Pocillopora damicornis]|uniref:Uncharacterized protein n=1 Tax=Pocillopora damicornis TaxID=46731 RepID=A0A3M6UFB1_POCDA|nr:hypothetical protein pdam_00007942 [Pocillopora damicornis]